MFKKLLLAAVLVVGGLFVGHSAHAGGYGNNVVVGKSYNHGHVNQFRSNRGYTTRNFNNSYRSFNNFNNGYGHVNHFRSNNFGHVNNFNHVRTYRNLRKVQVVDNYGFTQRVLFVDRWNNVVFVTDPFGRVIQQNNFRY